MRNLSRFFLLVSCQAISKAETRWKLNEVTAPVTSQQYSKSREALTALVPSSQQNLPEASADSDVTTKQVRFEGSRSDDKRGVQTARNNSNAPVVKTDARQSKRFSIKKEPVPDSECKQQWRHVTTGRYPRHSFNELFLNRCYYYYGHIQLKIVVLQKVDHSHCDQFLWSLTNECL